MVSDEDDYLGELEMEGGSRGGKEGNGNWWGGGRGGCFVYT